MLAKLEAAADGAHLRSFATTDLPVGVRPHVTHAFNRCIEACIDSEKTYVIAATNVRDARLRVLLHDQATRRGALVTELQGLLGWWGCYAENEGSVSGAIRRGLLDLRLVVEGKSSRALVVECERADREALSVYDAAHRELATIELPKSIMSVLEGQREILFAGHSGILGLLFESSAPSR